jgi:hypothetical protein
MGGRRSRVEEVGVGELFVTLTVLGKLGGLIGGCYCGRGRF